MQNPKLPTALFAGVLLWLGAIAQAADKPNIILFFVDDLGWADLGHRNPAFESPNIDQLAQDGTTFQQAYVACPTCSPSRGTLLTGQHPARLQLVRHIYDGDPAAGFDATGKATGEFAYLKTDPAHMPSRNWLPLAVTTYAEALKPLGYYSVFVGKWHLGTEEYFPIHQGFDRQIGTTPFGHPKSYYPPYFGKFKGGGDTNGTYLTDHLTDEAVGFIERYDKRQPFMMSFYYYAVHGPHIGRKDLVRHFKAKGLSDRHAEYAAMVKAVDESVGRVRAVLEKRGLAGNTIILFLSDQGGFFENKPLRGGKMSDTLCEGGARVPFIFHWPGVTKAGATNDSIVQSTDLFPTLVEIAGGDPAKYPDLDGVSLFSILKNNDTLNRGEPIFGYRAYEDLYASVREDDWKLLAYRSGRLELYNLADDIGEAHDLSKSNPAKVAGLRDKLTDWEKKMGVQKYSGLQSNPSSKLD